MDNGKLKNSNFFLLCRVPTQKGKWVFPYYKSPSLVSLTIHRNITLLTSLITITCGGFYPIPGNSLGLPRWLNSEESTCSVGATGDLGSVPGLGRSPEGGHGDPLQDSCWENPMDRGALQATVHGVTKSWHDWVNLICMYADNSLGLQLGALQSKGILTPSAWR